MDIQDFFQDLEESVDALWENHPPRIELKGWWWKRHIPHYRRLKDIMQKLIDMRWREEYPNIKKELESMKNDDMAEIIRKFSK